MGHQQCKLFFSPACKADVVKQRSWETKGSSPSTYTIFIFYIVCSLHQSVKLTSLNRRVGRRVVQILHTIPYGRVDKLLKSADLKSASRLKSTCGLKSHLAHHADVAQLVEATDLNPVKCGFDSLHRHHFYFYCSIVLIGKAVGFKNP